MGDEVKVCIACRHPLQETKDGKYLICMNDKCPRVGLLQAGFARMDREKLKEVAGKVEEMATKLKEEDEKD